jgi:G3E family GTPase
VTALRSGFHGGNKTSLLDCRVSDPALADAAVIITAFGEIDR